MNLGMQEGRKARDMKRTSGANSLSVSHFVPQIFCHFFPPPIFVWFVSFMVTLVCPPCGQQPIRVTFAALLISSFSEKARAALDSFFRDR
jgi:hypothetical protein